MKRIKSLLKCKKGMSTTVGMLGLVLAVALIMACVIGVGGSLHEVSVLDNFTNEMALKAGELGKCKGIEIDEKYAQLKATTGLSPVMTITTSDEYFNSVKQSVQYGDQISVKLVLNTKLIGFQDFFIPIEYTSERVTQSEQYWK